MRERARYTLLVTAGLVALLVTNVPFLLFDTPDDLGMAMLLFVARITLSVIVTILLLRKVLFPHSLWIALTASLGAYFLGMLTVLPVTWFHLPSWLEWPFAAVGFVGAFWLSDGLFNGWRVRLRYKVVLASAMIVALSVVTPLVSLYVERAALVRGPTPGEPGSRIR